VARPDKGVASVGNVRHAHPAGLGVPPIRAMRRFAINNYVHRSDADAARHTVSCALGMTRAREYTGIDALVTFIME
jgi:hypothetical protein